MNYSRLTQRIAGEGSAAWDIHIQALQRRARGEDVTILSVGDPDFDTPAPIVESAVESLRAGHTHYPDMQGKLALRQAIAAQYRELGVSDVVAENVIVLHGAQCGLYAVAQCLLDPEDEVVVPEPTYVTYEAAIKATGARISQVPLSPDDDFRLRLEALEAAITPRTKALMLNSPHNPSGQIIDRATWEGIAELCHRHDLWLVSDEVYADLVFDGEHLCPATLPDMAKRTVVVNSLSKSHAMTGWRLGWVMAPHGLIGHLFNLSLCMLYGCPSFLQDAALEALRRPPAALEEMKAAYRARRDTVCRSLADSSLVSAVCPAAGMFLLVDIRRTGLSAKAFSQALLDDYDVSVLSAEAFGPSGAGFVRLSLTVDEALLIEACRRLLACAERHARSSIDT
ncbi:MULTISPECIES: pyridoxal phosphate-dependent aminotransferase [unclassified Halomonas]|uniref:pyridoxal phosphate-dependent aminotransferase n=1 Tax=unclassified Halomonas TaxID=2609666 RepID=UPI002888AA51|nr:MULTISPECIES: pyridoxal phosphate-dependent aminotransferase [unclassified Halomonas]MDT0501535.1 pyridoxal phosphate-dependent aminotransferase [Halomonas sp. PAR7]MDT0512783.1 pyridoxal phosphate-dependent aminotransferase [Halomonas sp. LES1]MDT0591392.1 pyridoxal phosphate-dependent aminotransferase [Halomonas sp. PAR8]